MTNTRILGDKETQSLVNVTDLIEKLLDANLTPVLLQANEINVIIRVLQEATR